MAGEDSTAGSPALLRCSHQQGLQQNTEKLFTNHLLAPHTVSAEATRRAQSAAADTLHYYTQLSLLQVHSLENTALFLNFICHHSPSVEED